MHHQSRVATDNDVDEFIEKSKMKYIELISSKDLKVCLNR